MTIMHDTVVSESEYFQRQDDLVSKILPNSLVIIPNNLASVRLKGNNIVR